MINFNQYKIMQLAEVATIERAIKGKQYPAGCTLIPLSAADRSLVQYHDRAGEIASRYAVVIPGPMVLPYYLHLSILNSAAHFFFTYQTTINLKFDLLEKYYTVAVHDLETQRAVIAHLQVIDADLHSTKKAVKWWKNLKETFLDEMFV